MPRKITNLKYNKSQYLDLYLQDQPGRPLVICIHGGGFISGDKADERCRQSAELLTAAGFNCASISYSLAPRDNRFLMWPRNLFDVADALAFLDDQEAHYGYDFGLLGMLGFSAGCCLSNLYIQGGESLFKEFGYQTPVFKPAALVGFYGPYDFPSRQLERRSADEQINIQHSPSHWFRLDGRSAPPVLHIQGNRDSIVHPDQHAMFEKDYQQRGHSFKALVLDGFGHSFSPRDTNATGTSIDLGSDISSFFSDHLN